MTAHQQPAAIPSPAPPQAVHPLVKVLRVHQLEAAKTDEDTTSMLKGQLHKVFALMKRPDFLSQYEPELIAFLQFCIWRQSIMVDKPTPGNSLIYRDKKALESFIASGKASTGFEGSGLTWFQKCGYLVATVGVPYSWVRAQKTWAPKAKWLFQCEKLYRVASLVNFLVFLHTGGYRSLVDRLLNTKVIYQKPNMPKTMGSELMNRQLMWNEFLDLLLVILPLLNITNVKKVLMFPFFSERATALTVEKDTCPICETKTIAIPFAAVPCGHIYCYYCLRTRCTADRYYRCAKCNKPVKDMKKHSFTKQT